MCNGCNNKNDNSSFGAGIVESIFVIIFLYFTFNFYSYLCETTKLETEIMKRQIEVMKQINQ